MQKRHSKLDVDCIIPAAGLSSRMGSWKLMLAYRDKTIIETAVFNALSVCSRVVLVAGYRSDMLVDMFSGHPHITVVVNENYQQGMLSSIRLGVQQVQSRYFYIAHGDMPCIDQDIFHKLWQARQQGTVFPGSQSKSGHPVLIASTLKAAILNDTENSSMKAILARFPTEFLNLVDDNIIFDIDTPDAYKALCDRIR